MLSIREYRRHLHFLSQMKCHNLGKRKKWGVNSWLLHGVQEQGLGFWIRAHRIEQCVGKGQLTCLQTLGRMSARNLLIQPGGPKIEVWGRKLPKQNYELYRRRNKKCARERERGEGGWGWGPLKMTQGSQADHWPNIVYPSSPNPELTHCYLLRIGVFLKVLFGEPGKIMKKKIESQPPHFRDAPLPSTCIHHISQTSHHATHHSLKDKQDGKIWYSEVGSSASNTLWPDY